MIDVGALLERVEAASPSRRWSGGRHLAEWSTPMAVSSSSWTSAGGPSPASAASAPTPPGARRGRAREGRPLPGTVYEKVLRTQRPRPARGRAAHGLVVPVTDRGDTMGVIEMTVPREPRRATTSPTWGVRAHALAYVVVGYRRHTDLFEWGQRSVPFSLAAEIQRRLLPAAFTCEAGQFTVAGWLEPASRGRWRHVRLHPRPRHPARVDHRRRGPRRGGRAARHPAGRQPAQRPRPRAGPRSSRPRRQRRAGRVLRRRAVRHRQLVRIDLRTAHGRIVNAGHPLPVRVHEGRVEEVRAGRRHAVRPRAGQGLPGAAAGAGARRPHGVRHRRHARAQRRHPWTSAAALGDSADLHPREVVHELGDAVLRATGGELRDDATMVCLDWYGGPLRDRVPATAPTPTGPRHRGTAAQPD